MCAQFMIRANTGRLAQKYRALEGLNPNKSPSPSSRTTGDTRVLPYQKAPIVIAPNGENRKLEWMQFSLVPRWSKDRRVKFATHNARLESVDEKTQQKITIFEKPTWREAFQRRHCLVPITDFIEPIYSGTLAGNMVRFSPIKDSILTAAGIWEEWIGKDGEVIDSFAIITDDPVPFVQKVGHDRCPLFLTDPGAEEWLANQTANHSYDPKAWVQFLRASKEIPELKVEIDRPLKPGWEKRA